MRHRKLPPGNCWDAEYKNIKDCCMLRVMVFGFLSDI